MGIYINGMEMPTEGYIDVRIKCNGIASFSKEFSDSEYGDGVKRGLADAREYIKIATTVIPAEDGE